MNERPRCFDSDEQWVCWLQMEETTRQIRVARRNLGPPVKYCTDCTQEYAERMRKEGRCEHPEWMFGPDEEGLETSNTPSGYKGVTWHKRELKWQAKAIIGGEHVHFGYADTAKEAALLRKRGLEAIYVSDAAQPAAYGSDGVSLRDNGAEPQARIANVEARSVGILRHLMRP